MMNPDRPLIRYYGGKWKIADWIIRHIPDHNVYVEPFGGAGSVLACKDRVEVEVYNDAYKDIVTLFRVLRDPQKAAQLREAIQLTPLARDEYLAAFEVEEGTPDVEVARRLIVRATMGRSAASAHTIYKPSGFRAWCNEEGNTQRRDWRDVPEIIDAFAQRFANVVIENRDAIEVMTYYDGENTVHYVDPPYLLETRTTGKQYKAEMENDDHRRLADCLKSLRGMVLLSGYPSPLYDELFPDWEKRELSTFGDRQAKRTEVLWLSPSCASRQRQISLF